MNGWQLTFLGYKARILHPEYFGFVAAVALAAALLVLAWLRRSRRVRELVPLRLRERVIPGWSPARQGARLGASLLGVLLLATALVQPQCGTGTELARKVGIDVVVALDVSRSMHARDVKPSRFERARLELTELVDRLKGDRFGLVVFAGTPFVQCPLTTDYAAAKLFLRAVDPSAMPRQGTDVGAALHLARDLLSTREGARSQVVVLLTDGEDHGPDALAAAEALAKDHIRVFAVGIGSATGEPIPVLSERGEVVGYKRDRDGGTVLTRLDQAGLEEIARVTKGTYVHAGTGGVGIPEVIEAIDNLEKAEFESRMTTRFEDRSALLIVPGFLLLLLGTVLRPGRAPARLRPPSGGKAKTKGTGPGKAAAALLALASPILGGAGLLEAEHPVVAEGNEAFGVGDHDAALEAYDRALAGEEDGARRSRIHYNRGTAYSAKGEVEPAREAFKAALEGADEGLQAKEWYNLGTALLGAGDAKGAAESLVRSLKLDPTNRAAKYNLELALRALEEQKQQEQQAGDQDQEQQDQKDSEQQEKEQQEKEQQEKEQQEKEQQGDSEEQEQAQKDQGEKEQSEQQEQDQASQGEQAKEGEEPEKPEPGDQEQQGGDPGEEEAPEQENQGEGGPEEQERQAKMGVPEQVDEQEGEQILEALRRGEKPLQMQLFGLKDYKPEARPEEEKDW